MREVCNHGKENTHHEQHPHASLHGRRNDTATAGDEVALLAMNHLGRGERQILAYLELAFAIAKVFGRPLEEVFLTRTSKNAEVR